MTLYLRKNNTTDYSIMTDAMAANSITISTYTVSIPVAAGDYIEYKLQGASTWTTLPYLPGAYVSAYVE